MAARRSKTGSAEVQLLSQGEDTTVPLKQVQEMLNQQKSTPECFSLHTGKQ